VSGAKRIRLSRARGWRLPAGAVSVARPTRWGNPFGLGRMTGRDDPLRPYLDAAVLGVTGVDASAYDTITPATRVVAVEAYRAWLTDQPELRAAAGRELAGRVLACWCPLPTEGEPDVCHAAELLRVASDQETGR